MATSCIYKSVTLSANEVYTLPPNAEVIYISDTTKIVDSCDRTFPTALKTCYRFRTPMRGNDVDVSGAGNLNFFIVGFKLDDITINIDQNYNYSSTASQYGTAVESTNAESPADRFTSRLANNIWYQLVNVTNGAIIAGVHTEYTDSDQTGGDIVEVFISVPDIFTNVSMLMIDKDSQGVNFNITGIKGYCYAPASQGAEAGTTRPSGATLP